MSALGRLIGTAAAVTALSASSAGASATLGTPSGGASMTTTHPAFAWTLPAGERAVSISVARSPDINPDTNDFMPGELADTSILAGDASKWAPTRPLPASKYYWHVSTRTEDRPREFSAVSSFLIRPLITRPTIEVKPPNGQRMLLITTSWTANVREVSISAQLFAGRKRLGEHKLTTDNFLIDNRKQDLSIWILPPTVEKGARLRFVAILKSASGAKATATKILRAP